MRITVSLDTQAVITQPAPLRFKASCFNPIEIAFTRGSQSVPLPDGAVIEFALKPRNQWTGGLLAYLNAFSPAAANLYTGSLNCATTALLGALGLSDQVPANDVAQIDASAEVTWSFGGQKFRSATFAVTVEAPLTDANIVATPDPERYPPPENIALKTDIPTVGTAAALDAGIPNGAATLDEGGKLTGTQVPDSVALKANLGPTGSNRIVITNRFALANLPSADVNGNPITKVNIGDVVHQVGSQGTPRTAVVVFSEYSITDDDINNDYGVRFFDENGTCAGILLPDFGGAGTVVYPSDFAYALANAINSNGLNVSASVTGEGQVTITSNTMGPLPGSWSFQQDTAVASYAETEGTPSLPPGDFIAVDLNNLGNATGYQGIGNTVDFLNGYGAPTADIGEEGNGYVDQNNGDFYHRDANGWSFVLNIKGPQGLTGPQGAPGAPGAQGQEGQIGMVWKGTWTYGSGYFQHSVVYYNGSAYYAIYDVVPSTIAPSADHINWTLLAQAGAQGPQGPTGAGLTWRGVWISGASYAINDGVLYGGSTYVANASISTNQSPEIDTTHWSLVAQGLNFLGAYSDSTTYRGGNVVTYAGGTYRCSLTGSSNVTGNNPTNASFWTTLAQAGAAGATGATGATGKAGGNPSSFYAGKQVATWTARTLPSGYWKACVWAPELGLFCMVHATSAIAATSPDGITWTQQTTAFASASCVTWSPDLGLFCLLSAVSPSASAATSPDGVTWTARTLPASAQWAAVAWSSDLGLFCATASGGGIAATSPDGVTWTQRAMVNAYSWSSVIWVPELGLFYAVASNFMNASASSSPDGITWTARALPGAATWAAVTWSPELGLLCAVASDSSTAGISSDGVTWTKITLPVTGANFITWSPELGLFCATVSSSVCITSPDGVNWTQRTLPSSKSWSQPCWSPELGVFCFSALTSSTTTALTSVYPKKWTTNGGFYKPVATSVANVATSTMAKCRWSRQGRVVYVEGSIQVDPTTTATLTQLRLSLPTPSTFTATTDLSGTFSGAPANHAGSIAADVATGTALFSYTPTDVTNQTVAFAFSYTVMPF